MGSLGPGSYRLLGTPRPHTAGYTPLATCSVCRAVPLTRPWGSTAHLALGKN